LFGRVVGEHPVGTTRRERYGKTDTDASPQMRRRAKKRNKQLKRNQGMEAS
jgi:hypothetical protein